MSEFENGRYHLQVHGPNGFLREFQGDGNDPSVEIQVDYRSKDERASVGSAARRATLVRKLRREIENPVMLVDSGDTFTRGPLTNAYEGIADAEAMNAVSYDVDTGRDAREVVMAYPGQNAARTVTQFTTTNPAIGGTSIVAPQG